VSSGVALEEANMHENILEMKEISKIYPGVVALNKVDFSLKKGEIHALIGENGAGKTTLIKILAGAVQSDGGAIFYDGNEYDTYSTSEALDMGISVIYQEFNLIPMMTVEENLFFGKEIKKGMFCDKEEMLKLTREAFKILDVDIDPETEIRKLSIAYQQLIEIAKAIINDAKIIVMDEPSAVLTNKELDSLFNLIKHLKNEGTSIIYISHRLDEVFEIADSVTVLRDGLFVDSLPVRDTNKESLIKMMVGRELTGTYPHDHEVSNEVVLEVKELYNEKVKNASFSLRRGEILGITGLVGAGRTELARMIFGADDFLGEIYINGEKVKIKSPLDAIQKGIALLPEDRKEQGLILSMKIDLNISMVIVKELARRGIISDAEEQALADEYIERLSIRTPSNKQLLKNLSGGNQQKVVIAKWLASKADIIIIDEPTRGIDVGAKAEIYELMDEMARQGKSIIMITSELPELIGMSDRAIVMYKGHVVGELDREEFDQERMLTMASSREGVM